MLEPYQSELLSMSLSVLGSSLAGAIIAAYLFRNVFTTKFIIIAFVLSVGMIFVSFAAAETSNAVMVLGAMLLFGACSGCTLGGFVIAVTHEHPRAKEVVGITVGIVAISTFAAAAVGMFSGYNFQSLGAYLFIGLLILIGIGVLQLFIRVEKKTDLIIGGIASVFWVVYMVYNFNKVVHGYDEASWRAAADIGMNTYLDMVNLFIRLLPIIAEALSK